MDKTYGYCACRWCGKKAWPRQKTKCFAMLGGLPLLVQCLRMINDTGMADKTIIAAGAAEIDDINKMLAKYRDFFSLLDTAVVAGGAERTDSVKNALALTGSGGFIAVHDGARPFAGKEVLNALESCRKIWVSHSGGAGKKYYKTY